jgi:sulfate-transporting ATPase
VISLDCCFLARIASRILIFRGDSKLTFFDGHYSEDEEWRRKTLGHAVIRPHRITYRELSR